VVLEKRFSTKDEAFYRRLILPEEDRTEYAAVKSSRSYRWFRSANVVCLEHYKRPIEAKPAPRLKAS
jgi:hypothetical protein